MLSKIGSYLGNPLFAHGATTDMAQISYARIYVEIEAGKVIPDVVPLVNEHDEEFLQTVDCCHCKLFGHDDAHCKFGGAPMGVNENVAKVPGRLREWKEWRKKTAMGKTEVQVVENEDLIEEDSIVDRIVVELISSPADVVQVNNPFAALEEGVKEVETDQQQSSSLRFGKAEKKQSQKTQASRKEVDVVQPRVRVKKLPFTLRYSFGILGV
ncbi:hypothetical protein LIER_09686 [Lithospermum erythrorhizon]|uniref:Uncharacterized protein n=1 Tax=Lithospermum erythrorhizon TaxID=34254 RepID=A0AAV3PGR0_LITER